jgi:hypothetical protein
LKSANQTGYTRCNKSQAEKSVFKRVAAETKSETGTLRNSTSEQETFPCPERAGLVQTKAMSEYSPTVENRMRNRDQLPTACTPWRREQETQNRISGRRPLNLAVSAMKGKIGEENQSRDAKNTRRNRDLDVGKQRQTRANPFTEKTQDGALCR